MSSTSVLTSTASHNATATASNVNVTEAHNNSTGTYSSTIQQKQKHKPYFIFHVGPPKTATTAIQCGLAKFSQSLAEQDSYYYLGKPCDQGIPLQNGEPLWRPHFLLSELSSGKLLRLGQQLRARLEHHSAYQQEGNVNHNVIVSIENFEAGIQTEEGWNVFQELVNDWHVRIVISYRRWFEWLPSLYFQQNKKKPAHTTLLNFLKMHLQNDAMHPTNNTLQRYLPHFDDILIFDIHQAEAQGGDVIQHFICQALPTADRVCEELKKNNAQPAAASVRVSTSLDYYKFAHAAKQQGYTVRHPKRTLARFQEFQQSQPDHYHSLRACLPPSRLEDLFETSKQFEQQLVPLLLSPQQLMSDSSLTPTLINREEQHRALFEEAVTNHKFCEINTTKATTDTRLMKFLFPNEFVLRQQQ